jgi:hypothetical protein
MLIHYAVTNMSLMKILIQQRSAIKELCRQMRDIIMHGGALETFA